MNVAVARQLELILHVGFHKTGSSSIQETFSRLEMPHIQYADWGGSNNHSGFFSLAFFEQKSKIYGVGEAPQMIAKAEAKGRWLCDRLRTILETCQKSALMISAEALSSRDNADAVRAFRDFVGPYASAIGVHAYVRPHADLMVSTFQQRVKMGTPVDLSLEVLHRTRFDMLDDMFGAENVRYHRFQRPSLVGGDVVKDLAHRLGITLADHEIVRANESIGAEAMGVLFCHLNYGRHRLGYPTAVSVQRMLVKELGVLGSTPFRFSAELVRKNLDRMASDVAWVEQRLGLTSVVPSHGDGVTTEDDLLALGVAQRDGLATLVADLSRQEGCKVHLPGGPAGPHQIAAMVDLIKDILSVRLDRETAIERLSFWRRDRSAKGAVKPERPPMRLGQKISRWIRG